MSAPIFTIQNEAGTEFLLLKDDNDVGNAIPTVQGFRDLDIRQDYASGDVGKSPIRLPHEFILSMDYVTQEIREKLLEWKFARERVTLADLTMFGPDTMFAYKPVEVTGGGHTDLTGDNAVAAVGDAHLFGYWDHRLRVMEEPRLDNQSILVDTEFGKANLGTRKAMNRAPNPYPESATDGFGAGKSGWESSDGTPDTTLVITHVPGGFDNTLCPDTIRVTAENLNVTSGTITLSASDYFTPADPDYGGWLPPATAGIWLSIWVKGRFPAASFLSFGPVLNITTVNLNDYDTDTWTRIDLGSYNVAYTNLRAQIQCTLEPSEFADFEIGPVMIVLEDDSTAEGASFGGPGHFTDQTDGPTGDATVPCYMVSYSFQVPISGTATMLYSVPDDSPLNSNITKSTRPGFWFFPSQSGAGWDGMIIAVQRSGAWAVQCILGSGSEYWNVDASALWSPGLHALTIVWGSGPVKCFLDGVELTPEDGTLMYAPDYGMMYFNGLSQGPYTGCSIRYHGFSIQSRQLSAGEIAGLYGIASDTVARNLVEVARGRLYEIVSVPSVPLIQDGFTRFMGDLRLRQVKYLGTDPIWFAEDQ